MLGLDDFADAAIVLGLVVTVALGRAALLFLAGGSVLPAGPAASEGEFCVELLVVSLELLDVGLGVLEQVHLLLLEVLHLHLEGLRVELQLLLDLDHCWSTLMRLRISVSWRCNATSSLRYSSSSILNLASSSNERCRHCQ